MQVFDGATLIGTATANGSGAWTFTTATLADGSHSLTATASDAAGNISAASDGAQRHHRHGGPGRPGMASFSTDSGVVGDGITNDNTLTLTGTAAARQHGARCMTAPPCSARDRQWQRRLDALPPRRCRRQPSLHRQGDGCGRQYQRGLDARSTSPSTPSAPGAPTVASFSTDSGVVGDGITNDNTLTLTGTAAAATVKVYDGATQLGTATANGSGAWTFTTAALANGGHSLTAKAIDAAGNASAASTRAQRHHRHGGPGCPDHGLVLDRQRRGRRRHHQRQHADADRHGGGRRTVQGLRRRHPDRHGDRQWQRRLDLCDRRA